MTGLPIGLLTLDARMRVVEVDAQFAALFGSTTAELVGRELEELISERDRRGAHRLASRLNAYRGELIDLQLVMRLGARDHFVRLRMLQQGAQFLAYVESSEDPSSLAFQLALLQQRWTTVFNRSEDGIAILDADGKLVEHNERFLQLLQFRSSHGVLLASEALDGRRLIDLCAGQLAPLAAALAAGDDEIRVLVPIERGVLDVKGRTVSVPMRGRVETFLLVRDITDEQQVRERDEIIRADLAQAAGFQQSILSTLPDVPDIHLDVAYQPLDAVGGDLYDVTLLPDGTLRLFLGDATGHGVRAALATLLIKSEYDAVKDRGASPAETLGLLNDRIVRAHKKLDMMFTGVIVDLDAARSRVVYANGAHPGPLVVRDGRVEELPDGGPFVGALKNAVYPEWSRPLGAGDALVLVTDGITETRNVKGDQFGEARLQAAIARAYARQRNVAADVVAEVRAHRDRCPPTDDITILSAVTARPLS